MTNWKPVLALLWLGLIVLSYGSLDRAAQECSLPAGSLRSLSAASQ